MEEHIQALESLENTLIQNAKAPNANLEDMAKAVKLANDAKELREAIKGKPTIWGNL